MFMQITADATKNIISFLKSNISSGDEIITTNAIKHLFE